MHSNTPAGDETPSGKRKRKGSERAGQLVAEVVISVVTGLLTNIPVHVLWYAFTGRLAPLWTALGLSYLLVLAGKLLVARRRKREARALRTLYEAPALGEDIIPPGRPPTDEGDR